MQIPLCAKAPIRGGNTSLGPARGGLLRRSSGGVFRVLEGIILPGRIGVALNVVCVPEVFGRAPTGMVGVALACGGDTDGASPRGGRG